MHEVILSVVLLFLLRESSRNSYNLDREEPRFSRNIKRMLKIRPVHGDTLNDVLVRVDPEELQRLKSVLVKLLISRKVFYSQRLEGKYMVAIDATGTHSLDKDYCNGNCLNKTSKNGVISYSHAVLEAKLVTASGFAVSLASVWLENNADGRHEKQDCELAAFKRLVTKLKELYPRLPIVISCDALYANGPVMQSCKDHGWDFILVIKEGVLDQLHQEIKLRPDRVTTTRPLGAIAYLKDLEYKDHKLCWIGLQEAISSFSWITNIAVSDSAHAEKMAAMARLRWKIENEGFNIQKNTGYNLQHRYSRISFQALKNYYQCLQIAHLIEQLALLEKNIKQLTDSNITISKLIERLRNMLVFITIDTTPLEKLLARKVQFRFE